MRMFKARVQAPDLEWVFIDNSIIRAHQHSTGAATQSDQAIGKSVGGNSTKIHMGVDAYGLPLEFLLSGGQVHDSQVAPQLINALPLSNPVIPRKRNSKAGNNGIDWCLYKYHHLVKNIFARLKHFRAIATRYDKLERNPELALFITMPTMITLSISPPRPERKLKPNKDKKSQSAAFHL